MGPEEVKEPTKVEEPIKKEVGNLTVQLIFEDGDVQNFELHKDDPRAKAVIAVVLPEDKK